MKEGRQSEWGRLPKGRKLRVRTEYGLFDVPNTTWSQLRPYWADIVASVIEVLYEGGFNISEVRKNNPTGFVASTPYWRLHNKNPTNYPLHEAKRFLSCIKKKPRFTRAISQFNRDHKTDWLREDEMATLGGFLHSFCSGLTGYLRVLIRRIDEKNTRSVTSASFDG